MTLVSWYRLGDGTLGVQSSDAPLAERFEEIYGECRVDVPATDLQVVCRTATAGNDTVEVTFTDPEPLDEARFLSAVFPERDFQPAQGSDGQTVVRLADGSHAILKDGVASAPARSAWQPLVANLAVSRLLRLQRSIFFFHAASFDVGGKGLLVCGPKGGGKTTLALSLGLRGHEVLGDEVAALRVTDRSLLPFRRSLAVREGPAPLAAGALLAQADYPVERFPDGQVRRRLSVAEVSPSRCAPVPLTTVLVLRQFTGTTTIRPLALHPDVLGALTPMAASLWDRPAGAVVMRLMNALANATLYEVHPGAPDDVAGAIERLMEDA